jgi:hypothetical protein
MRGLIAAPVAVLLAATLLLSTGSASAGKRFKDCGDTVREGAGAYNVHAERIGCRKARRLAKAFARDTTELYGFTCHAIQKGEELFLADCVRQDPFAVVKFEFGS